VLRFAISRHPPSKTLKKRDKPSKSSIPQLRGNDAGTRVIRGVHLKRERAARRCLLPARLKNQENHVTNRYRDRVAVRLFFLGLILAGISAAAKFLNGARGECRILPLYSLRTGPRFVLEWGISEGPHPAHTVAAAPVDPLAGEFAERFAAVFHD
jgi:hypothetical protein